MLMEGLTRRGFLATSGMSAGLGVLAAAAVTRNSVAQAADPGSTITSNFNGTKIAAGDYIWFTSVIDVHGLGVDPVTIGFSGSLSFVANGLLYVVPVPSALVSFVPGLPVATTAYCNGQWVTSVPLSGLSGNVFLDGVAFRAPSPGGLPGGIKNVTWQGMFFSTTPGLTIQWKWAAAVYHALGFSDDYNALGVKAVDDTNASAYLNSHHAGTPENFTPYVVGGARGGGGSNYTGSYSGTDASAPMPASLASVCGGGS
jgi:hypothetical protein